MKNYKKGLVFFTLLWLTTFGLNVNAQKRAQQQELVSTTMVISQVYGGGGNGGSTYTNDFIEIHNKGNTTVDVTGWSVQYASATGTSWQVTNITGMIAPGKYYLIQEAMGAGGTTPLPTPDATGTIAMSATAGKIALVNTTTALTGACPTSASIIDFVGFGATANCFEGTGPTPAPSNTTAANRIGAGNVDTDRNPNDFLVSAPTPRNIATPAYTAANANIAGRVTTQSGSGLGRVQVTLSGGSLASARTAITNPFGYYQFDNVEVGEIYILSISSKRYTFQNPTRTVSLEDNLSSEDFVSNEP